MMEATNWVKVAACLAAGFCMGLGTLGPALGQGFIGGKACENLGKKPESSGIITRVMVTAMVFAESGVIYAFVVALILIFKLAS